MRTSGVVAGVPVFTGTRVPLQALAPYLCAERGIEEFLRDYPAVTREQVYVTLCRGIEALVERGRSIPNLEGGRRKEEDGTAGHRTAD